MATTDTPLASPEPSVKASDRVRKEVEDVLRLLDYAVASGFRAADGRSIPPDLVSTIKMTVAKLGLCDGKEGGAIPASEWVAFEVASYNLAVFMNPVTAETLRNTEGTSRVLMGPASGSDSRASRVAGVVFGFSPAQRFTRGLWMIAIGFAVFVVGAQWALQLMALADNAADDRAHRTVRTLLELLLPWAYGGLGSCVFLLRSAHTFIYERTFDLRRKPEYLNRILLGTFAGGAIILFVSQVAGDDGAVIQLSSNALGFLAGYSTDFLFQTIERIIAALLPKVGIDTMRPPMPPAQPLDVKDLADRYEKATGPDKDFYKSLMEHATGVRR